jgi:hypothetical protein
LALLFLKQCGFVCLSYLICKTGLIMVASKRTFIKVE